RVRLDTLLALSSRHMTVFFFFQAEDGIRDWSVTGVQTCALPISTPLRYAGMPSDRYWEFEDGQVNFGKIEAQPHDLARLCLAERSEERRVGKECRSRGSPDH